MPNLYADVGAFARRFVDGQHLNDDDAREGLRILEAASRAVDAYTRRKFYARTATRYLRGTGARVLELNEDLTSILSSVEVDSDDDRVYEDTLANGTDYELANIDSEDDTETPYNALRLLDGGVISAWPTARRAVKIPARWGYSDSVESLLTSAGVAVTGTLSSSSDVTLALSALPDYPVFPGMTLRLGSEDIYVRSGEGTSFVVTRGVNGTTAATQSAVAAYRYVYEADVVEATMIQAGRLWKRKDTPLLSNISGPAIGYLQTATTLDPDIAAMLARLRHYGIS